MLESDKFITSELKNLANDFPNKVRIFYDLKTCEMTKYFKHIKFFWILTSNESFYYEDRLCGMIPLSLNFNIPPILPRKLNDIYQIQNCIIYDNELNIDEIINLSNYEKLLENFEIEKKIIISNNDKILQQIFLKN